MPGRRGEAAGSVGQSIGIEYGRTANVNRLPPGLGLQPAKVDLVGFVFAQQFVHREPAAAGGGFAAEDAGQTTIDRAADGRVFAPAGGDALVERGDVPRVPAAYSPSS